MMSVFGPRLRRTFVQLASAASRRHVAILPREAAADALTLDLHAPYRVENDHLAIDLNEPAGGAIACSLIGYTRFTPNRILWRGTPRAYTGPARFEFDSRTGAVTLGGQPWDRPAAAMTERRFCWRFTLTRGSDVRGRLTSHYRAVDRDDHSAAYFGGDNYVDYEEESASQRVQIVDLMQRWHARGPLLEVGCATGALLAEIQARTGIAGYGVDISTWAIEQASARLGPDRVWAMDLDADPMPPLIAAGGPLGTIVMFSVLEHLADPPAVLEKLTRLAAPGTLLLLETTNAASLSHQIFGRDWEGFFDWTHHAVDRVDARTLPVWLESLGWRMLDRRTRLAWDRSADPTHATLRDWWDTDARFRRLLTERDLGDLLMCIAVKG